MKSLLSGESINKQILKMISIKQTTNYDELEAYFNLSRKTISKYLDEIEEWLQPYDIKLVRKQNLGIYLSGRIDTIFELLNDEYDNIPNSRNERSMYILMKLLSCDYYMTIQKLADDLYVSRSTLENDLKIVKEYLKKYSISITKSKQGIKIDSHIEMRKKLLGDIINVLWRENVFILNSEGDWAVREHWVNSLQFLIDSMTLQKIVYSVNVFFQKSRLYFSDYEFQSLITHLIILFSSKTEKNIKQVILKENNIEIGTELLIDELEKNFNCFLSVEEIESINLHMLSAIYNKDKTMNELKSLGNINEITTFLKEKMNMDIENKLLEGLSIHLISAIKRVNNGIHIYNPCIEEVKRMLPEAYEKSIQLKKEIYKQWDISLSEDECAFIALHFETLLEVTRVKDTKITALIVCNYGVGSSRLLEQRILKYFHQEIKVTNVISYLELKDRDIQEDIVISTFPIEMENKISLVVSPILTSEDRISLSNSIGQIKEMENSSFFEALDENSIFHRQEITNREDAISFIGKQLMIKGYAKSGIIESALKREQMSTTAFDNIAIPHCETQYVKKSNISMLINKRGIDWGDNKVSIVFFMSFNQEIKNSIRSIYHFLSDVIDNPIVIRQIQNSKTNQEVIKILSKYYNEK